MRRGLDPRNGQSHGRLDRGPKDVILASRARGMNSATDRRIREALTVKSDASVFDASLAAWKRDESTPWGRLRRSIALRNLTKHIGAIPNLFDTGSHDVVLHNVLSYVENAGAALAAATYSLKPSGILSLMQVNRYSEAVNTAVRDRDLDAAMSRLDTKTSTARQFANVPVRRYASIGVTHRHGRLLPGGGSLTRAPTPARPRASAGTAHRRSASAPDPC